MKKRLTIALALLGLLILWLLWGNTALEVSTFVIEDEKLPSAFDGFRIAQVSDLHNGDLWEHVIEELEEIQPDLIVLTGDLIDSSKTDVAAALAFAERATDVAPCYYVSGNHEAWSPGDWEELRAGLVQTGVLVLEDEKIALEREGEAVKLLGLRDPAFGSNLATVLEALTAGEDGFTILLSHRPERLPVYAEYGVDLVFSGHAHGGQFRIPFLGGLIAPDQGLFPEYDAGRYELGDTTMLLSRGVGNSIIPLRLNNRPEILVAELKVSVGNSE
mgnify:CR=1 FL=1